MKKNMIPVFIIIILSLTVGCTSTDSPEDVAKKFWTALEDRDVDKARKYATKESAGSLRANENKNGGDIEITFGEVTTKDNEAIVETTMRSSNGGKEIQIPMKTILVREDGEWKVEAQHTMLSMFGGAMGEIMQGLGKAMKESMKEMGKAMAEGMKEGMKESMEEMKSTMEKSTEENIKAK